MYIHASHSERVGFCVDELTTIGSSSGSWCSADGPAVATVSALTLESEAMLGSVFGGLLLIST